jgi:cytochrome P450
MVTEEALQRIGLSAVIRAYQDPHALFDALRRRAAVAYDHSSASWLVTDHAVARTILADARFSSALQADEDTHLNFSGSPFLHKAIHQQLMFADGERHRRAPTLC